MFRYVAFIFVLIGGLGSLGVTHAGSGFSVFSWPQPGDTVIGDIRYTQVAEGETLLDIGERYGLGYADMRDANPNLDPWIPEVGATVVLPTQFILPNARWQGIVINLAEYRLYHFLPERSEIHTYPVGIGVSNTPTPTGDMQITARIPNPTWYPPESIRNAWESQGKEVRRQIPAGPDNPLGPFAINLSAKGYLIHGTNQKFGIGTRASAGCIRMNNWDIERLVTNTHIGVEVTIINQPVALGVRGQKILLKAHPPPNHEVTPMSLTDLVYQLNQLRKQHPDRLAETDWDSLTQVFTQRRGIASPITF